MTYSRNLDGLRGVAIMLVLFFHYDFILGCGWIGVQLFFVLSGFLITSILLKEKDEPLDFYLKRFYWRRTLRIFPLYYAYIALIGIVFILAAIPEDYWSMFPFLATYTFNFYPLVHLYSFRDFFFMHFWSLSVEEQFYLIWPLVIFFCNKKQLQYVLIGIIVGAPLTRFVLGQFLVAKGYEARYVGETVYRFTLSQWDGFAFGALIPVFGLTQRKFPAGKLIAVTTIVLLGLGVWNFISLQKQGDFIDLSTLGYEIGNLINYQQVWSYSLFDALFFLTIICVMNPTVLIAKIIDLLLGNRLAVFFGKISYGLYVYHFIIWMAFNKFLKSHFPFQALGFVTYVMICVLVASISYYVFERPILSIKDKYFTPVKTLAHDKN